MLNYRLQLKKAILNVTAQQFDAVALQLFQYQVQYNPLYRQYIDLLNIQPDAVQTIEAIPFLPISLFKKYSIQTGQWTPSVTFTSSGTTGATVSQHLVQDIDLYQQNTVQGFNTFYKDITNFSVLALLPAYLERKGSSLVYMAHHFIQLSNQYNNGFFLSEYEELLEKLKHNQLHQIPTLLLGVSFALLDLAEQFPTDLSNITIMETGGMKGRREEITRADLHQILGKAFNVPNIHSEYGMTELLSQAYSKGQGLFRSSPTLKILTREITDPLTIQKPGKTGIVNIIDLANIDSCCFIATDDLGKYYADGSFEILGRLDYSDIRGCNLMFEG